MFGCHGQTRIMTLESDKKQQSEPTVILYGGTFDPPHRGHQGMLERARTVFPQSCIWISVAPAPAGAAQQHKAPHASYADRQAMCRLNFADAIKSGAAILTDIESKLPAPNYTVQTLQFCRQQFPGESWALLIGQDQLEQFALWREPLEILKLADLIVVGRGQQCSLEDALQGLAEKLGLHLRELGSDRHCWVEWGSRVYLLPGRVSDAASRELRNALGMQQKNEWLVPEVASYIERHGIYTK